MSSDTFNIRYRGRTTGPYSPQQLGEMIRRGQVTRLHEVSESHGPWQRLRDRPDLLPADEPPASPAATALTAPAGLGSYPVRDEVHPSATATEVSAADDGSARWWFSLNNHKHGSVTRQELEQVLAFNHESLEQMLIWRKGMIRWLRPQDSELNASPAASQGPPPVPRTGSNPPFKPRQVAEDEASAYLMAGFWMRAVALMIDSLLIGVIQLLVLGGLAVIMADWVQSADDASVLAAAIAVQNIIALLYFAAGESSAAGCTPGKRAMGLRVISETDKHISFGQASGRYLGKVLSGATLGIGFLLAGIGPRHQALHDMLCRTLVIQK